MVGEPAIANYNGKTIHLSVGAVIRNAEGKILMIDRLKTPFGFACPAGHIDEGEAPDTALIREVLEETGLKIKNIRFAAATNDISPEERTHYLTIFMVADYDSGELQNREPEKCECWDWFDWNNLPQPLFISEQNLLKQNYNPFNKN